MPTLLELAQLQNQKNGILLTQSFIKKSGLLMTMPFNKSNRGTYDKDNIAANVPQASFRVIGGGISTSDPKSKTVTTSLFPFSMILTVDSVDVDEVGGPAAYLKLYGDQMLEGAGQKFSAQTFNGSDAEGYKGIRQIIIENHDATTNKIAFKNTGTAAASGTTSIYFVKWHNREMTGLYNKENFKASGLKLEVLNNGSKTVETLDDGTKRMVYEFGAETMLGLKSLGIKSCSMVYNLKDASTFTPTLDLCKQAIRAINGSVGDTYAYANTTGMSLIDKYLKTTITMDPNSTEAGVAIETINRIPLILDENISSNEDATEV